MIRPRKKLSPLAHASGALMMLVSVLIMPKAIQLFVDDAPLWLVLVHLLASFVLFHYAWVLLDDQ